MGKPKMNKERPTLVFSDTHIPYHHKGYLEFLQETHKKYNCKEEVICLGDLVDHHAISRFTSEPDAMGDRDEFAVAFKEIKRLVKAFPKVILTTGNHDTIPGRQAATLGLSQRYMKSFSQLWELPSTWKIVDEIIIDNVLYSHGLGAGGKDGTLNKAIAEQISNAQGHIHSFGGCKYIASKRNTIFGLNTGCLCDPNSLAMAYGKHARYRPTLGCGIVFNDKFAMFVPFIE
jgi:predicted phosphodiesterase